MTWIVDVRGKVHTWSVAVSDDQAKAMQEDGFTVYEAVNTIPAWVVNLGLTSAWCRLQDLWNWPSRWGR